MIDAARFAAFAPKALPGTLAALQAAAAAEGITDRLEMAHWLGQMHVESQGFTRLAENLNYSDKGLISTFGPSRISPADAARYGRTAAHPADQKAIANIVYGGAFGRKNLGNTQPNDGWDYRGGGLKQITGRANYAEAGHEHDPDTLRTNVGAAARSAAHFWVKHGCAVPARADNVSAVTKIVNGGFNALDERAAQTTAAKRVVGL